MTDERRELAEIARALRAHAEWQRETGATGLPRAKPASRAKPIDESARAPRPAPMPPLEPRTRSTESPPRERAERAPKRPSPNAASAVASSDSTVARAPLPSVPADPEQRIVRLAALADEVAGCKKCRLCEQRTQTVFSRGNPRAELCFVGEGPGADEDARGEPFVGKAGQLLDRMIAAMGFSRDEVYVCNIVKCRPPGNRKPEPDEVAACSPYLVEQLALVAPKVIVALGATAVEGLLGSLNGGITRTRGQWRLYKGAIPVMPTFHPAYLLRNPAAKREVWADLQAVLAHLGRKPPPTKA